MKKYSLYLKIALFITLSVVFVACPEPIYYECTWEARTTNMSLNVCKSELYDTPIYECEELQEYDSCSYDSLRINMFFDAEILPDQETCSSPHDSLIGFIEELLIICIKDYNNEYKSYDTINFIINVAYTKPIGLHGKYEMIESPISLQAYLTDNPLCTPSIYMFLNIPPDTTRLHQFIIVYEEDDGTKYQDTTVPVYIKP